jgi:very-short-patch-repair endonuclease
MEQKARLASLARELRKNMTLEERILWYQYLRTYPVQWNRQKVIGPYIVDFYCKRAKLIIELDGSQHYDPEHAAHDQERTAYLNSLGYTVLRFANTDVKTNLSGVCAAIDRAVQNLPLGEGGSPKG